MVSLICSNMIGIIIVALAFTGIICQEATTDDIITAENTERQDSTVEITTGYTTILEGSDTGNVTSDLSEDPSESRRRRNTGDPVSIKQYPFVVALFDRYEGYACVGSIISSRLILTAFHCIDPEPIHFIRVGHADKRKGTVYSVQKNIKHPLDVVGDYEICDIALLLLKNKISNAPAVRLIPDNIRVAEKAVVRALGWGRSRTDEDPNLLSRVALQVSLVDECKKVYPNANYWICTDATRSATCKGDSGGPVLYYHKKTNTLYQIGIVSGSQAQHCGLEIPTRNVNVRHFKGWINSYSKLYP